MARQPRRPTTSDSGGWTALTPERQEAIVRHILAGNYIDVSARAAGIDRSTFTRWMQKGADKVEVDEETGESTVIPGDEPYRTFRIAVEDAEAQLEARVVARYAEVSEQAAFGNAAHMAGFLGRRFRARWDPKSTLELTGPGGGPVKVESDDVDRLAGTLEALARAGIVALAGTEAGVPEGADPADE